MLVAEGALDAGTLAPGAGAADARAADALEADALDAVAVGVAVHRALRAAPSWLIGLALEDLVGETEPVNMPGVAGDRFESWTRRLGVPLEALAGDARFARAFGADRL
jgi:4-alpha-glucanotransferase